MGLRHHVRSRFEKRLNPRELDRLLLATVASSERIKLAL